jgi:hypothetical protein
MIHGTDACCLRKSRKVKCDEERPCKNCKKISAQVPQIVCWQFSDFIPVLFPDFIRGHFKKEVMARFISDNVSEFYGPSSSSSSSSTSSSSTGEPCLIELSSGWRFRSTLTVPASFFAPKSAEVLQHWHMGIGVHQLNLHARSAVPVGVDPQNSSQREALKRRAREYVQKLADEPRYAEQVTEPLRGTQLPRRVLTIVQQFAERSQSAMVKRAMAIYAAHYVLTRQLCLTPATLQALQTAPSPFPFPLPDAYSSSFTTARILNRQVKAVLDEYLLRETRALFTTFCSALKPRSRAEWAPCLASFLVLCLLFEGIEAAADTFVVSEAEIALRTRRPSAPATDANKVGGGGGFVVGGRRRALDVCREIDNLPFRQVAYRFHAAYQTHHVREPGVGIPAGGNNGGNGGPTFNPLVDPVLDVVLDPAAAEMAVSLRALLDHDDSCECPFPVFFFFHRFVPNPPLLHKLFLVHHFKLFLYTLANVSLPYSIWFSLFLASSSLSRGSKSGICKSWKGTVKKACKHIPLNHFSSPRARARFPRRRPHPLSGRSASVSSGYHARLHRTFTRTVLTILHG